MGSGVNFKSFADGDMNQRQTVTGNLPLARQNSVFSLTFDEFQNTWGGLGKDFGSMNMDELLKNIWNAEENQAMRNDNSSNNNNINNGNSINTGNSNSLGVAVGGDGCVGFAGGNLQRQGSLTLPRTLSQKTVDEVWKELMRDSDNDGGSGGSNGGSNVPQRQQTLGEMTLEEFLVRAGVVREEPQSLERPSNINGGFYGFGGNTNFGLPQNSFVTSQHPDFSGNAAGIQMGGLPPRSQPQQLIQQQQTTFPKQATIAFNNTVDMVDSSKPAIQEVRSSTVGMQNCPVSSNSLQAIEFKTSVAVAAASPRSQMSPDLTPKSNMDAFLSPVPYMFGRGRRSGAAVEKVIERRQKRMIKNRESAARSRARKQAYTLELEAEVAKLKELNNELQKKQAEIMEMQKNQLLESLHQPWGCKRQCLRRTLTGPW
ncbi:PREDICTED: ABSCISIC ACID-INSENSITIVE 5-like protein 6 [Tarenaya hassleriana]|uniref:ABSCISIC ACID-INSENSITIVE 5-like protein 6 n=1 Tax=Tarenaya hassleriana TaxID=28532 RepID=UPI00053C198B|nr:PREDICTED: ABSCISIC ACID-INSENSITIVE 5-like protein 6 [Tarenaya hassleriana]XP_010530773.1 PREDICTED: ABSCISIC ACID-INSENSITIVE 5-like protein 6 [Tarenaya hassleriana]